MRLLFPVAALVTVYAATAVASYDVGRSLTRERIEAAAAQATAKAAPAADEEPPAATAGMTIYGLTVPGGCLYHNETGMAFVPHPCVDGDDDDKPEAP